MHYLRCTCKCVCSASDVWIEPHVVHIVILLAVMLHEKKTKFPVTVQIIISVFLLHFCTPIVNMMNCVNAWLLTSIGQTPTSNSCASSCWPYCLYLTDCWQVWYHPNLVRVLFQFWYPYLFFIFLNIFLLFIIHIHIYYIYIL